MMRHLFLTTVLIISIICEVFTVKMNFIPDETISTCDGTPLQTGETLVGELMDIDLKFILEDDKKVRMAGGFYIKTEVESKLFLKITGEHKIRGEWIARISRVQVDACDDLFNPEDIYFRHFKDEPRCPWQSGVSRLFLFIPYKFNFILICYQTFLNFTDEYFDMSYLTMRPDYEGNWRFKIELAIHPQSRKDCFCVVGDMEY